MAKKFFLVVDMNRQLQVFDADTERKQYLDKVLKYNNGKENISQENRTLLSMIEEGRIDEVFTGDGLRTRTIGNVTTYLGHHGVDDPK